MPIPQETRFIVKPNEEKRAWELIEQHGDMERLLARCYDGNEHRSLLATAIAVFLNTGMLSIDEPGPGEAGALYAFMGWLTTREQESGPFSRAGSDALPAPEMNDQACQLVAQFIKMQGWPPPPDGWHHAIKPYIDEDPREGGVAFVARREYEFELATAQDTVERLASLLYDCASLVRRYHHTFSPKMQSTAAVLLAKVEREDLRRFDVSVAVDVPRNEREYQARLAQAEVDGSTYKKCLEELGTVPRSRMLHGTWEDAPPGEAK